jgi:predicted MFS family arabinose efflux permease
VLSAPAAAAVSAGFFVLSCLSVRAIRRPESPPGHGERPGRMGRRIGEGVRLVVRDPTLRSVAIASAIFQFSFAALMTVYLLYLPRVLDLSGAAVGLVLAALGPGALVGSWLAAVLPGRRLRYGVALVSAAVIADAVLLCVAVVPRAGAVTVVLLMAVNFVFGVAAQVVDVTVMAVRQAITPVELQGRVVATLNFVGMGLTPLGSLLGGVVAAQWGLWASMLLTAVALALSPLFMALSPLARLGKTLPHP